MKKLLMLSAWAVLLGSYLYGQNLHFENPSFEYSSPSRIIKGEMPSGFIDCSLLILQEDSLPPKFNIHQSPSDGESYLGLTVHDDRTWERVGVKLDQPMRSGERYLFHVELSRNRLFPGRSRKLGTRVNFDGACKLRIWAGKTPCGQSELLAESGLIANHYWQDHAFLLFPKGDYAYLIFEAFYDTSLPFPYNGNLLLDNASPLVRIDYDAAEIEDRGIVRLRHFEVTDSVFGEEVRISFFAKDEQRASAISHATFGRGAEVEKSIQKGIKEMEDAGWSRFNVNPDFFEIVNFSLNANRETKGAFDTGRQQDLYYLWEGMRRHVGRLPNKVEVQDVLDRTGIRKIAIGGKNDSILWMKEKDVLFDWMGIGKAHAMDEMVEVLFKNSRYEFTISMEGMAFSNMKEQVYDRPFFQGDSIVVEPLPFSFWAIASARVETLLFEHEGETYYETMMPMRGRPLTKRKVVSVKANDCKTAYIWSQALLTDDSSELMGKAKLATEKIWYSAE